MGVMLAACVPISKSVISEILRSTEDVKVVMSRMGTLLDGVADENTPIRPLHASFKEYLLEESFSKSLNININLPEQHGSIAQWCLDIMNEKLKMNILGLPSKDVLISNKDIYRENGEGYKARISSTLRYACRYWIDHVTKMLKTISESILGPLQDFLANHFPHWLEVISVVKYTSQARYWLLSLYRWLTVRSKVQNSI